MTTEDPKRGGALRFALTATASAGLVTYLADAAFALSRGSTFDPVYFGFNALVTLIAIASTALLARLLRGGPLLALTLYAGLEGLAQGVAPSMLAGTALGLYGHQRMRAPRDGETSSSASVRGAVVGLAIAVTLILGTRAVFILTYKVPSVALLMLVQLAGFGLYEIARSRIAPLARAAPRPEWVMAAVFLGLFVALPSSFDSQRGGLPTDLRGGSGVDKPHVLVIILDTVRADRMGIYGHHRDTTPRLAQRVSTHPGATIYPMAFSTSSWTVPSHASLFTGLYPFQHGVHRGGSTVYSYGSLPEGPTLAETFKEAGYLTAGVYANVMLFRIGDGDRGFDVHMKPDALRHWVLLGEKLRERLPWDFVDASAFGADAAIINEAVLTFFDECGKGPCFAVANYMTVHTPREAHAPHVGMYEKDGSEVSIDRYDEALRSLDERIDELLTALDERGLLDHTWIFVTSDHGEGFNEHVPGPGHGFDVYNEEVRIPLVVLPPHGSTALPARETPVSLVDVTATAAAIASGRPLGVGRDLRHLDGGRPEPVLAELYSATDPQPMRTVVQGNTKLIDRGGARELYRLDSDPGERDDLSARDPELTTQLTRFLPREEDVRQAAGERKPARKTTPEEEAALRALGYAE